MALFWRLMRNRYVSDGTVLKLVRGPALAPEELERIAAHAAGHRMSLAVVRTEKAPSELLPLFEEIARACSMSLRRTLSSPASEFGIAEFDSNSRILIVLYMGGPRTQLVSLSEIDERALGELEESIHSSNFHSEIIRIGL